MVFAATGSAVVDGRVLGARFRGVQRTAEGPAYRSWFTEHGSSGAAAVQLRQQLGDRGFEPVDVDLSELLKAGGNIKRCTLELR